ncbi:MAG: FAD-binding oxidoreductase [Nocardioides sp.]|nr:FAD-binding oxidoreductase [Nocardioides sp.]
MRRVIVVGAGVIGLTSAVRLLEAGYRVDVLARELPLETTSAVAAAIWSPYSAPQQHVVRWARRSYDVLADLAADEASGVVLREGTEVFRGEAPDLWWRQALPPGAGPDRETSLPSGYDSGWTMRLPVVEMPQHLRWLARRVEDLGGTLTRMNLSSLPEPEGVLVVNAGGLGAKHLGADPSVHPVRGQVVVVEQLGLDRWTVESEGPTYVIPRSRDVVVGGTAEPGEWSRTPDPAVAADVLRRATRLVPELARAKVLRHRVGLRPGRPEVRLERQGDVIHCYGHGGCGVTVAWGCAEDVVGLADG